MMRTKTKSSTPKEKPDQAEMLLPAEASTEENRVCFPRDFKSDAEGTRVMTKTMLKSIITSVNACVNDLIKSVATIKTSLEYTRRDVDDQRPIMVQLAE